jgi:hypothetical protein
MIRLRAARYDASARSVTLELAGRLPLSRRLVLRVDGTPPDGLTGATGVPLAGGGRAGTDYVAEVGRAALAPQASGPAGGAGRPGAGRHP